MVNVKLKQSDIEKLQINQQNSAYQDDSYLTHKTNLENKGVDTLKSSNQTKGSVLKGTKVSFQPNDWSINDQTLQTKTELEQSSVDGM